MVSFKNGEGPEYIVGVIAPFNKWHISTNNRHFLLYKLIIFRGRGVACHDRDTEFL